MAVGEVKAGTAEEIQTKLKEKWDLEIPLKTVAKYLMRWRKAKYISANMLNEEWLYSLRDIPTPPEAQMVNILKPDMSEEKAKEFLDNYKQEIKERGYVTTRQPNIRDYEFFEITLEIVDKIAGGQIPQNGADEGEQKTLVFTRLQDIPIIPRSWLVGWIRDNARLINMTNSIKYNLSTTPGEFTSTPEVGVETIIGEKGPVSFEVINAGAQFRFELGFPMHGSAIHTEEKLKKFLELAGKRPIRGLGAFNKHFGGRLKLISMEQIN